MAVSVFQEVQERNTDYGRIAHVVWQREHACKCGPVVSRLSPIGGLIDNKKKRVVWLEKAING